MSRESKDWGMLMLLLATILKVLAWGLRGKSLPDTVFDDALAVVATIRDEYTPGSEGRW